MAAPSSTTTAAATERPTAAQKFLTFTLGSESYGIEVLRVREIVRLQPITPVPHMPDYVLGVINLRGKVIPAIDLRIKFQLSDHSMGERTCIVIVMMNLSPDCKTMAGLIVDAAEEVCIIPPSQVEPPPDFGGKISTDYMVGMAKIKGRVKTLLDINKVISVQALKRISEDDDQKPRES